MELFLGQLINGLTIGSTYALVALGIVVIFSVLDVMSIAQGQIFITDTHCERIRQQLDQLGVSCQIIGL